MQEKKQILNKTLLFGLYWDKASYESSGRANKTVRESSVRISAVNPYISQCGLGNLSLHHLNDERGSSWLTRTLFSRGRSPHFRVHTWEYVAHCGQEPRRYPAPWVMGSRMPQGKAGMAAHQ